jgi:hypothetical protein
LQEFLLTHLPVAAVNEPNSTTRNATSIEGQSRPSLVDHNRVRVVGGTQAGYINPTALIAGQATAARQEAGSRLPVTGNASEQLWIRHCLRIKRL